LRPGQAHPMATVVLDLNGTLTDVRAIEAPWHGAAPQRFGAEVLDEAVAMAMTDTLTGVFRPFPDLLRGALERRVRLAGLLPGPIEDAAAAATRRPAHEDAVAALEHLRAAGHEVAVLTNSAKEAGTSTLAAADLQALVDRVDGADAAQAYKPDPSVYALTVPPADAWFVAAHWWDVTGAKRAGFRTVWVSRDDLVLAPTAEAPDLEAPDLLTAARRIVEQER
jgi:2-haloacid dehalogenase